MAPRPNERREPLDLYSFERQAGGIEPGEFATRRMRSVFPPARPPHRWPAWLRRLVAVFGRGGAR